MTMITWRMNFWGKPDGRGEKIGAEKGGRNQHQQIGGQKNGDRDSA